MTRSIAKHGHREHGPIPLPRQDVPEGIVRFGQDIGNLGRLARDRAAPGCTLPEGDLRGLHGSHEILPGIPAGADVEGLGLFDVLLDEPGVRIAELGGLFGDFMQDMPQIEGGADGAAHLAQRVDLFQRLLQFAGPLLNLLEESHILDGDDRLVGKGLEKLDLLVGEGLGLLAAHHDRPERDPFTQERCGERRPVAEPSREGSPFRKLGLIRLSKVPNMDGLPIHHCPTGYRTAIHRDTLFVPDPEFWDRSLSRSLSEDLPIQTEENSIFRITQARGVLRDSIQHGLEVCRGATDNPEDLAGGGLLFEGLGELAVALLDLVEQTDVLDGDDGLVGEGLEQGDLLVGERANLRPTQHDRADRNALRAATGYRSSVR